MELELIVTEGLGDNSYVVSSAGEALVVDPQRDAGRLLAAAAASSATITHVLETHVHNDYVSGARELQDRTGAEIVGPANANYEFPYRGLAEGDALRLGDLRVVAVETPGHTPEHISYLVYEGSDVPVAVFTGGSLMVGGAGRTDLLGTERADELTRAQYRTLRRLAALPDTVQVLPTHGQGSFCAASGRGKERVTTMAEERVRNRALSATDEATFVQQQLSGLLAYPTYYRRIAPINRSGPRLLRDLPRPRPLSVEDVEGRLGQGTWLVDARAREEFAAAHVPGSVNIEIEESFASYVGWIVPFGAELALVVPEPEAQSLERAFTELIRIGYERIAGYLRGGIDAWRTSGRDVASYPVADFEQLCREWREHGGVSVLDVRQEREWKKQHIPQSRHLFVGELPARMAEVPRDGELWAICASGQRSAIAASLLDREGIPVRLVARGGVRDFLAICGPSDDSIHPREPSNAEVASEGA